MTQRGRPLVGHASRTAALRGLQGARTTLAIDAILDECAREHGRLAFVLPKASVQRHPRRQCQPGMMQTSAEGTAVSEGRALEVGRAALAWTAVGLRPGTNRAGPGKLRASCGPG